MARSGKYRPGPDGSETQTGAQGAGEDRLSRNASKAARREAARLEMVRAEAASRRRRRLLAAVSVVAAVVVIIAVVLVATRSSNNNNNATEASSPGDPAVIKAVTQVPANIFDTVGAGGGVVDAKPVALSNAPALTQDGKPRVLYVGAEYCPYCAAERWAIVAALSRFGTFSNLGQTTSSSSDIDPSTATLSFHGASYTSKYLSFTGVEQTTNQRQGNGYAPLDTLAPADEKLLETYDTQKYVGSNGGIPFIDFGGKYVSSGSSYDPAVLQGLSHQQIAHDLSDPSSTVAKAIIGTANTLTVNLCSLTNQQPAAVCSSAGVKAAS